MKFDLETYIFEYYYQITKRFYPYENDYEITVYHTIHQKEEKKNPSKIRYSFCSKDNKFGRRKRLILKRICTRTPLIQKHIHIDNSVCKGYIFKLVSARNGSHEQLPIGTGITCPDTIMMQSDIWDIDL